MGCSSGVRKTDGRRLVKVREASLASSSMEARQRWSLTSTAEGCGMLGLMIRERNESVCFRIINGLEDLPRQLPELYSSLVRELA